MVRNVIAALNYDLADTNGNVWTAKLSTENQPTQSIRRYRLRTTFNPLLKHMSTERFHARSQLKMSLLSPCDSRIIWTLDLE